MEITNKKSYVCGPIATSPTFVASDYHRASFFLRKIYEGMNMSPIIKGSN